MGTYTSFSPERKIYKFMIKNNTISPLGGAGGTRNNFVIWAYNISLLYTASAHWKKIWKSPCQFIAPS